jgi:hypothetical protein
MEEEVRNEEVREEEVQEEQKQEGEAFEKPLDRMTVKELREIALGIPDVTGVHAMKKEELLVIIKEARGIKEEKPVQKVKRVRKAALSVGELKVKIRQLKHLKREAREARDRKKTDVLRRRISRLKKMTRRVGGA